MAERLFSARMLNEEMPMNIHALTDSATFMTSFGHIAHNAIYYKAGSSFATFPTDYLEWEKIFSCKFFRTQNLVPTQNRHESIKLLVFTAAH
jgi:hypothetical protein